MKRILALLALIAGLLTTAAPAASNSRLQPSADPTTAQSVVVELADAGLNLGVEIYYLGSEQSSNAQDRSLSSDHYVATLTDQHVLIDRYTLSGKDGGYFYAVQFVPSVAETGWHELDAFSAEYDRKGRLVRTSTATNPVYIESQTAVPDEGAISAVGGASPGGTAAASVVYTCWQYKYNPWLETGWWLNSVKSKQNRKCDGPGVSYGTVGVVGENGTSSSYDYKTRTYGGGGWYWYYDGVTRLCETDAYIWEYYSFLSSDNVDQVPAGYVTWPYWSSSVHYMTCEDV